MPLAQAAISVPWCRFARYCGKECQQAHWKKHREGCRPTDTDNLRRLFPDMKTITLPAGTHVCGPEVDTCMLDVEDSDEGVRDFMTKMMQRACKNADPIPIIRLP